MTVKVLRDTVPASVMDLARVPHLVLTSAADANSTMPAGEKDGVNPCRRGRWVSNLRRLKEQAEFLNPGRLESTAFPRKRHVLPLTTA